MHDIELIMKLDEVIAAKARRARFPGGTQARQAHAFLRNFRENLGRREDLTGLVPRAIELKQPELLAWLHAAGADINPDMPDGFPVAHHLCVGDADDLNMLKKMHDLIGEAVNRHASCNGNGLLHTACLAANKQAVTWLVKHLMLDVRAVNADGFEPIHVLAACGKTANVADIARFLKAKGADIHAPGGPDENSVIVMAALNGNVMLFQALNSMGANPHDEDADGNKALHLLGRRGARLRRERGNDAGGDQAQPS